MKEIVKRFWPYIKEYKLYYLLVIFGGLLILVSTVGTAQIMKPMMDDMFIKKDKTMLYIIPLGLIAIYVTKAIGKYIQTIFMEYIGQSIVTRFREILLDKMIHLDMAFLYANRSGELISRVTNDIGRIQYFVSNMLPDMFRDLLTVFALVGYIVYLNPLLSFYTLIVVPLIIYPLMLIAKKLKKYSHRSQNKNADLVSRLTEVFNNSEIIKANATEKFEVSRFSVENWNFFKINMKAIYVGALVSPIMEIIAVSGLAMVVYVGGKEVFDGKMTVGEFTAFITAVGLVFEPIRKLGGTYSKIQDALAASERVFEIIDKENSVVEGTKELKEDIKKIEYKNVVLQYENINILDGITLTINQGEHIALVGDSGGGKSTFMNMLLRFYDPDSGEILINGINIKEFKQKSLKHHIALVSQRIYIFQDTLAANVAYGEEHIDEAKVIEALKLADAYDFVMQLEEGIYTMMSEAGANLSGGQRQRIAIARAIYKHASLLLFDEATSALDNESEKRIQKALDAYTKDKITLTIAHRLSTIEHADKILVLQKGLIVASGTHKELLECSAVYQRLAGELKK
ncbi:ATP-binding cassette domain-containing protein [Sulfurimonas sp. SWIR-19]|uniref:ABC transporter ATP-binding protein n=1 Tax=Sulfurimonas sp. SWIR-19 TaxID=2878390 RepID=UPI001CF5D918|nr:ABC transporter transmembrane domain-containing protein [Sulfurimonas sp. SWIR-19]UCM99584.1 ATP-binding cassette domain-containing protein [Sulfurimonas sp. SWIR-19]